jgi:hypothetical protein
MTTIPSGAPGFTRRIAVIDYGGHPLKRDYQAQGVVNPKTDLAAAQFLRICADAAAAIRMAAFCQLTLQCNDSSPAAPTVSAIRQMNKISDVGYEGNAPPYAYFPTIVRLGNGSVRATWPTTQEDDFAQTDELKLFFPEAHLVDTATFGRVQVEQTDDTEFTFSAKDLSNNAISDAKIFIEVA